MEEAPKQPKLNPVIYDNPLNEDNKRNKLKELLLLQALQETTDVKKLRALTGAQSVADVYRTFDIMAVQKEYQHILRKHGITLDYMVKGMKDTIESADKASDKLKGYGMLMKSMGIDTFESNPADTANWQDLVIQKTEWAKNAVEGEIVEDEIEMYEVEQPLLPAFMRNRDESIEGSHGNITDSDIDDALKKIYE